MALSEDEQDYFARLYRKLTNPVSNNELRRLENYYDGVQRLEQLGIAVPPEMELFVTLVNWPRIAVDSVEERLDPTGFRVGSAKRSQPKPPPRPEVDPATGLPAAAPAEVELDAESESEADDAWELWRIWQANDLDSEAPLGHLEALVKERSYIIVGDDPDDEDTPLVTVESPFDVTTLDDPRRPRNPEAAMKLWSSRDDIDAKDRASLFVRGDGPDRSAATIDLEKRSDGKWTEVDRVEHDFGFVPVTRMSNNQRLKRRAGRGDIRDIITLTDAAARSLTNLQVASETHAVPARGVIGASKGDFVDASTGELLPTWETYFGAFNALENEKASIFQFSASDLRNFHETVLLYARLVSALTGLPPHYLGFGAEQPPSAEAIKSVEARLVKRVERKQVQFGMAWERAFQLVRLMKGMATVDDPARGMLELLWRDAGTPTQAQVDDGAVKKKQAGILSTEGAMEMTGMSRMEIQRELKRLAQEKAQAAALDPIAGLTDQIRAGQGSELSLGGTPGANPATAPSATGRTSTTAAPGGGSRAGRPRATT